LRTSRCAALRELDEPWRVVARGSDYLLAPHAHYEQVGDVTKSSTRAPRFAPETDRLSIYHGGADTVVCLAHAHLSEVLELIRHVTQS